MKKKRKNSSKKSSKRSRKQQLKRQQKLEQQAIQNADSIKVIEAAMNSLNNAAEETKSCDTALAAVTIPEQICNDPNHTNQSNTTNLPIDVVDLFSFLNLNHFIQHALLADPIRLSEQNELEEMIKPVENLNANTCRLKTGLKSQSFLNLTDTSQGSIRLSHSLNDISLACRTESTLQVANDAAAHVPSMDTNLGERKSRPSYIIEKDCHIFGGCVDDDASDEFFLTSGAVYQSWPYLFEPGFRSIPLFNIESNLMSRSDDQIEYPLHDQDFDFDSPDSNGMFHNNFNTNLNELPSYSLDNFEINLFHVNQSGQKKVKKKKLTRQKMKKSSAYSSSINLSTSSSYMMESDVDSSGSETSDDDSDSYRAYKYRHAIGLNTNLNYSNNRSQSSLSENLNQPTHSPSSNNARLRLTTSFNYEEKQSGLDNGSWRNLKNTRFFSQHQVNASRVQHYNDNYHFMPSNNNLIF